MTLYVKNYIKLIHEMASWSSLELNERLQNTKREVVGSIPIYVRLQTSFIYLNLKVHICKYIINYTLNGHIMSFIFQICSTIYLKM